MPAPYPEDFKRHAMALVRDEGRSSRSLESSVSPSPGCAGGSTRTIDAGRREGLTRDEKAELAQLRRENRVLKMERDLLPRAAAFFANENVHPPQR